MRKGFYATNRADTNNPISFSDPLGLQLQILVEEAQELAEPFIGTLEEESEPYVAAAETEGQIALKAASQKLKELAGQFNEYYASKAGQCQAHHVVPQYLGGPANGPTVQIPATYHQVITNAFRNLVGYGQPKPTTLQELKSILTQIYSQHPIVGYPIK